MIMYECILEANKGDARGVGWRGARWWMQQAKISTRLKRQNGCRLRCSLQLAATVSGWWVGWHLQWVQQCPRCHDYSGGLVMQYAEEHIDSSDWIRTVVAGVYYSAPGPLTALDTYYGPPHARPVWAGWAMTCRRRTLWTSLAGPGSHACEHPFSATERPPVIAGGGDLFSPFCITITQGKCG